MKLFSAIAAKIIFTIVKKGNSFCRRRTQKQPFKMPNNLQHCNSQQ
jgi:hypothetical protein